MSLLDELPQISWRLFYALLCGLSPNSLYVKVMNREIEKEESLIEDPKEAERHISRAWG